MSHNTSKKVGRSIEEIIVRRKFENSSPITLPEEKLRITKMSQSVPSLRPLDEPSTKNERPHVQIVRDIATADTKATNSNYLADYSDVDKNKMIESLIRYTRTMQERMEVVFDF